MSCATTQKEDHQIIEVYKTEATPNLDGKALEECWNTAVWHALDQNWIGASFTHEDFNGRYKLSWHEDALYVLVEIMDDVLLDQNKDPLVQWWNDDCVEVFVDEDNSGGDHRFNHNAFAYHIALDGNVVDLGLDEKPHLYNDHATAKYITENKVSTWEIEIKIYADNYVDGKENIPQKLKANKKLGFAVAYCDNDTSVERENFIGSVFVPGEDKNQGWVDANIFGTLVLIE